MDATQAGSGSLEIMVNGGHVNCDVIETGKQRFRGRFVPEKPVVHTVEMQFNSQPVPGTKCFERSLELYFSDLK